MSIYSKEQEDIVSQIGDLTKAGNSDELAHRMALAHSKGKSYLWVEGMRLHRTRQFNNESK